MCHMPEQTDHHPVIESLYSLSAKGEAVVDLIRLRSKLTRMDRTDALEVVSLMRDLCDGFEQAA